MTTALEDRIREVFAADAANAPVIEPVWAGPTITAVGSPRRSRSVLRCMAAAAVISGIVGVAYVVTRSSDSTPTSFQPTGTEFPLTDLGPATSSGYITSAGLSRAIQVPGQPEVSVVRTVQYFVGATAEELRCASAGGGAGCAPDFTWSRQLDISISSSVDNRVADEDIWMWNGLPTGTAYVEYNDGGLHLWQRPVAGFSAFPNVKGHDEVAVAYAADGTEVGRADALTEDALNRSAPPPPMQADVDSAQDSELQELTRTTMHDCLTEAGATWPSANVATFASGVDQLQVWQTCVSTTKAVVGARVTAMGVRLYDPATAVPQNPDSPIHVGTAADCHTVSTDPRVSECSVGSP